MHDFYTNKAFGTWSSPITSDLLVEGRKTYGNLLLEGNILYWTEMRPFEKGRVALVKFSAHRTEEVVSKDFNVRTKVHEYGGACFAVSNEVLYFVNFSDQRIYIQSPEKSARPLTREGIRFADLIVTPFGLVAVGEIHHSQQNVENFLALIDIKTGEYKKLAEGQDFYASPTVNSLGTKLAWISWNHPNMPWDNTELWVADFTEGALQNAKKINKQENESIQQPKWSKQNELYFISDRTGWWNLYKQEKEGNQINLCPLDAEFGVPPWVFGNSNYDFLNEYIVTTYVKNGLGFLAFLNEKNRKIENIEIELTDFSQIKAGGGKVYFIGGSFLSGRAIYELDWKTKNLQKLSQEKEIGIDPAYYSIPESISYPSKGEQIAHAFYYPPKNPRYQGLPGTLPPLIVRSHGGPTSAASPVFQLQNQFWTSRGFAVLDVNYGGSTGYGREYRNLLQKRWGVVDVDDCISGVRYLIENKKVDPQKVVISGGSAGGYTTLCALTVQNIFRGGASYYGVSDLESLVKDTHKFESRYLDGLIGPYPQERALYKERSPIHKIAELSCPVIFFQGEEDCVVPLSQSQMMYEALKQKGIYTEMVVYPEEQHGFRKAENIKDSKEKELQFYLKIFYLSQPKDSFL